MSVRYVLIIALASVAAVGDGQWKHVALRMGLRDVNTNIAWNQGAGSVNGAGAAVYTARAPEYSGDQAWRNGTSLNNYYVPGSSGSAIDINDSGQAMYFAPTPESRHIMVDGTDYFTPIFGSVSDPNHRAIMAGLDSKGLPFWGLVDLSIGHTRVFHGLTELTDPNHYYQLVTLSSISRRGDALWYAWDGTLDRERLFLNDLDFSSGVLGGNPVPAAYPRQNDIGDVLWAGLGDATNREWRLFRNGDAVYSGYALPREITDSGHLLWIGQVGAREHLFRDGVDVSALVFGDTIHGVAQAQNFMNERGDVAWAGTPQGGKRVIYRNTQDLSTDMVGAVDTTMSVEGIDELSNVAWSGRGPKTNNRWEAFLNQFSLSRDALGETPYERAEVLAIGPNGHVLWYSHMADESFTVWLSTPVPEPTAWLIPVMGCVWLRLRRMRRI